MTGLIVSDRTGENIERGSFDRTGDSAGGSLNRPLHAHPRASDLQCLLRSLRAGSLRRRMQAPSSDI